MKEQASEIINISNSAASVSVDLFGGAITDFHLTGNSINPLTFRFSPEQMPENNKPGPCYQGHFACIGRWGFPSEGEIKAGLPNHGQAANLLWNKQPDTGENQVRMQVNMPLEGLQANRELRLDDNSAVFKVTEQVKNINPLGRLYNIVQHPSLAKPFLTNDTIINCNADKGFNDVFSAKPLEHTAYWPFGITGQLNKINLSQPDKPYTSVFSFTIKKDAKFGWVTAHSPENNLLIGYLWKRVDYPWINFWQDFVGDNIRYRGLEFGTTGTHKPYKQIIIEGNHRIFDEDTYKYIDAGETQSRSYMAFACKTPSGFTTAGSLHFNDGKLTIAAADSDQQIIIQTSLNI